MNKKVNIIGAGGHARSVINLLELNGIVIAGIYDDLFDISKGEIIGDYALKGKTYEIPLSHSIILAIGDNEKRKGFYEKLAKRIYRPNITHPLSRIEDRISIGDSNLIFANTYINSNAKLGNNNIINTGAIIEHETMIGSHNHIAIGAVICGRVKLGNNCMVGAGAVVVDKITICDDVIIGAAAVVIDNIQLPGTYVGNPARKIK